MHIKTKSIVYLFIILLIVFLSIPVLHLAKTKWNEQEIKITQLQGYTDDVSQLNATAINRIIDIPTEPNLVAQQAKTLVNLAKKHHLKISVAGAKHSMGGQTIQPDGIVINMRPYRHMSLNPENNILTVGAGALWQDVIPYLDQYGKSVAIMQAFSSFTVGGSLSVNAHGWQTNAPPLAASVVSFSLMNANGDIIECDRTQNAELFKLALGGYGLFGIILDVKLKVVDNHSLRYHYQMIKPAQFLENYQQLVKGNPNIELAYGRLRISNKNFLEEATLNYFERIDQSPALLHHQEKKNEETRRLVFRGSVNNEYGKRLRWDLEMGLNQVSRHLTFTRNELLNQDAALIENKDPHSTDLLQEYFIPEQNINQFIQDIKPVLKNSELDLLNITIRQVKQDHDSFLNYAREDTFGFVLLFNQKKTPQQEQAMQALTQQLVRIAINNQGTFYLPYRLHVDRTLFREAYPQADQFFALKQKYDPELLFSNKLYLHYR